VKLHAINKDESTKKFVGRKRKSTEKEGKEHHPVTTRGLGDAFSAGEDDLLPSDEEPLPLSFSQIGFFKFRGTQLVAMFPIFFFAIYSLCATLFMGIRRRCAWGCEEAQEHKEEAAMVAVDEQRDGK
jgi:hypothetical protein